MNRVRFESTSPRLALACAAIVMSCTALGVLVLLPASLHGSHVDAVAVSAKPRSPPDMRASAMRVKPATTNVHLTEKRS